MEMRLLTGIAILALSIFAGTGSAHADSKESSGKAFVGIEYRHSDIEMQTHFIRRTNGVVTEDSNFENPYTTGAGSLFVGYTLSCKRVYLSGRAFFNLFGDDFGLSAGSSRFTNKINHALGIELIPGVHILRGLSVFGRLGLEWGDFDFIKASPTSTTYNVSTDLIGTTLGFGLAYDITSKFRARIGFDNTRYDETEINAALGTRNDRTLVEPEAESFYLSIQYNFWE